MSHIKVNKFYVRTAYFFGGGDFLWRGALACAAYESKRILCKDRILFWGGDFLWRGALACMAYIAWFSSSYVLKKLFFVLMCMCGVCMCLPPPLLLSLLLPPLFEY